MTLFQAMASVSVDIAIRQLGGTAQFERIAHALGWTPPGSTCSLGLSPPMCSPTQSWDNMPMETDCLVVDAELADAELADHHPDTFSDLTPPTCR